VVNGNIDNGGLADDSLKRTTIIRNTFGNDERELWLLYSLRGLRYKMEDSSETLLKLQKRRHEKIVRDRFLGRKNLILDEDTIPFILEHIDFFVSQSRFNRSIHDVILYPYSVDDQDDDVWDKLGQAVGNFQELRRLHIGTHHEIYHAYYGEAVPVLDWEILAGIFRHVRQRIRLITTTRLSAWARLSAWRAENVRSFARAIRGHPTIICFDDGADFPGESKGALYSALATLPALESIRLGYPYIRQVDEITLANPESLTELLRVPSLRSVSFDHFSFTPALCQASANAFMEDMAITNIEFRSCSFSTLECAVMMANGLSRNTSVTHIEVESPLHDALRNALVVALPSNSTLLHLSLCGGYIHNTNMSLSPVFLALGENTGLKSLSVGLNMYSTVDEALCTAIKNGLGMNETLENLDFDGVRLTDDNASLWYRAFSFLGTKNALKSLRVDLRHVPESSVAPFRTNIVAMLQESASLESLSLQSSNTIKAEDFIALVTALQHNLSLKTFSIYDHRSRQSTNDNRNLRLTDDENKQMAALLKRNYAMESLPDIDLGNKAGDLGAILQLNEAGRRYLIEDGYSISKGVEVLCAVSNEINCVFLHLLENPTLCDRSAVEKVIAGERSNGRSTHPNPPAGSGGGSGGGKREQAIAHKGKESRRRLA
jgi:hypothetical protein